MSVPFSMQHGSVHMNAMRQVRMRKAFKEIGGKENEGDEKRV